MKGREAEKVAAERLRGTRCVRLTYQEVEVAGGHYRGLGLLQDIRLIEGYFTIADEHDNTIDLDIFEGRIMEPAEARRLRRERRDEGP